jgi:peptide/nickel transport system permease protein
VGRGRGPLAGALARQIGGALATLAAISVITFAATNLKSPEDVARGALGRYVTEEQLAAYVEQRGLDDPVHVRYTRWLGDFFQGDLGISPVTNRPVGDDLIPRLQRSGILALLALVIAIPLSFVVGAYVALRPATKRDVSFVVLTVVLASLPEFVVGIAVVVVFSVWWGVLPVDSTGLLFDGFAETAQAYVLPVLALVLAMVPQVSRIARATFRDVFSAPFMQAAVLRGLGRRTIMWRHALPNASVVLVHVVALNVIFVLGGVLVIENVFAFPGVGQLLVDAVRNGDAIMLQAGVLVTGTLFIAVSLAADLLASVFNPKLKGT